MSSPDLNTSFLANNPTQSKLQIAPMKWTPIEPEKQRRAALENSCVNKKVEFAPNFATFELKTTLEVNSMLVYQQDRRFSSCSKLQSQREKTQNQRRQWGSSPTVPPMRRILQWVTAPSDFNLHVCLSWLGQSRSKGSLSQLQISVGIDFRAFLVYTWQPFLTGLFFVW